MDGGRSAMATVQDTLKEVFGFSAFRPGQGEVIDRLVSGQSALAVFPTGGGKSLCYQLPALHFTGLTLVVSPLIALMKDQIDFLLAKGVPAARLDSSLGWEETRRVRDELRSGTLKLLYVAPERFGNERFLQSLRTYQISMMVIDEAHCISEWGHNFRPDYLKLARICQALGVQRVLALTATATPEVAEDIRRAFDIAPEAYVNTGFHRPNLLQRMTPCAADERRTLLVRRLQENPPGATIVYVTLQRTAEEVAELLRGNGLDAKAYHAGMADEDRTAVQDWFMQATSAVVVATIAFGMGIDKADIRYVYHYNLPKALENYAQEIGRAGRDGMASTVELFACQDDIVTLQNFSYGDTPTPEAVHALVVELLCRGESFDVSTYDLSVRHDIRPLVVSTLLCYLELDNVIAATGPFYNTYKFQPRRSFAEILGRFDPARARFLDSLFARAKKGRIWYSLDLAAVASETGESRGRLVAALNYLEEIGELELQVAELRLGYRLVRPPADVAALAAELAARFQKGETRDLARIRAVLDLAAQPGCTVRALLGYFGEDLGRDCGHCDRCLGEAIPSVPPPQVRDFTDQDRAKVRAIRAENHQALATPRQLARFFCGLSSPAASRVRPSLSRHPSFGMMADRPFGHVLDLVEE